MNDKIELEHDDLQFGNIPLDCRVHILSYLSPTDLYNGFAHCSRQCHSDSLDRELPQTRWGEFHVGAYKLNESQINNATDDVSDQKEISMESLLQRIIHLSFRNAWQHPRRHMKILGIQKKAIVISQRIDDLSCK